MTNMPLYNWAIGDFRVRPMPIPHGPLHVPTLGRIAPPLFCDRMMQGGNMALIRNLDLRIAGRGT